MLRKNIDSFRVKDILTRLRTLRAYERIRDKEELRNGGVKKYRDIGSAELRLSSFRVRVGTAELKRTLSDCGITPEASEGKPLVFFAGYNAKIALKLKQAGFNVVFSDILKGWTRRAKRKGLKAIVSDAKKMGVNPSKILAYVSYQPFMLSSLRFLELMKAHKGLIIFDFFNPRNEISRNFQRDLRLLQESAPGNIKIDIKAIPNSRTPEKGQLCVIHLQKIPTSK